MKKEKFRIKDINLDETDLWEFVRYGCLRVFDKNPTKDNFIIGVILIKNGENLKEVLEQVYGVVSENGNVDDSGLKYENRIKMINSFVDKTNDWYKNVVKKNKNIDGYIEYFAKEIICDFLNSDETFEYKFKNEKILKQINNFENGNFYLNKKNKTKIELER